MAKISILKDNVLMCSGRLVGIIDDEECRAIINSPDAGKKIFTSSGISVSSINSECYGKRFVVATLDYGDTTRKIFISPIIRCMSYMGIIKNFKCEDDSDYAVRNVTL